MGISFPLDGTAPVRPRCADKGQPVAGAAASARSVSEGRCGRAFLSREERRNAGGRKFGKQRCGKPAKRSVLLTWARIERGRTRSEEHKSELQSLMRISYAVFCLKKKKRQE